jgi:hypothetical protein
MAGGCSHWYHYRICFDGKNRVDRIFREDKDGVHRVEKGKVAIIINVDGSDYQNIKFEYDDYECKENEMFLEWYDE